MIISGGPEPTVATARFIPSGDFTNRICCCIGLLALTGALQDSTPIHAAEMCPRSQLLAGALGPEQSFLHSQAASVAGQRPVAANDSMTGDDERQRVVAITRPTARAARGRPTRSASQPYVRVWPLGMRCVSSSTARRNDGPIFQSTWT